MRSLRAIGLGGMSCAIVLGCASMGSAAEPSDTRVLTGVDVLVQQDFAPLAGRRVGLITNPTGVTRDLRSTIDVLHDAENVELVALFGPEHGVRGEAHAGDTVEDARDTQTGLPMYSLYGKNRKPTAEMLEGIDTLVFDIQDIGSRSYTFISTMAAAMESAAQHNMRFVVLDRPNPITGTRVEGRVLDMQYKSFVGYLPIPYLHGMTVGELARMINGEGWLPDGAKCDLQVVEMRGWRRAMWFDETGLIWTPPSPHVPRAESAAFYAATGIMGELQVISEGVGYTLPFELAGHEQLDPQALADELNRRKLPGVHFRPLYFRPFYTRHEGKTLGGVQVILTDRAAAELTPIQFHVMDAAKRLLSDLELFGGKRDNMFDKVCGTDRIRAGFNRGVPLEAILKVWNAGVDEFRAARQPYLLYE